MANGNDGASVLIDVGVDIGSSYTSFSEGIKTLVEEINKNPPKIRVELDLSHIKSSSIKSQLEQELNGRGSRGSLTSTIDASTLTKTAEGAKNASDEILRLKNETKSLNTTLNTASKRLSSFDAQLTKVRNPKTGETSISDTTKQLIDLQNKIREINTTTKGITTQYFGLKTDLGGEAATGDSAVYVEQLKNKYLELMNAVELVRVKNATASAEEIQQVYALQGEMDTLIAQIREKIATEEQESAQLDKTNSDEAEHTRLLRDAVNLQNRYSAAIKNSTKAEYSTSSSQYYQSLKDDLDFLNKLVESYTHNGIAAEDFSSKVKKLTLNLLQNFGAIKANGDATKTFSERIGSLAEKFSYWFSITRVIMAVYRAMRQMVSASIELDDAMTQLRIVTKDTEETYERFGDKIADTAKKIGSSISDLLDSTTVYARLGYSLDESSMLAEYTAMLQNVGNIDVSDAQDAITAIVKAFDVNVDDIESIMDKLVTTGNNFPISVAQIAEGMNNASSALAAAGNTFEQSVALLTAANTTIQNAAKSSTGLRTIAARIRNTKTELDELGEEMLSEAKYEELVQQLTDFNVALTTVNGEYRSTYDIMYDIAQQWSKMTSMEQSAIATAMSGTRQQAVFYSIIEQFQEATGAMDAMSDSAGELQKSYDIYMESTTAHINQFKAAFQELGADTFTSEFLQQFIDIGTSVIEFLDGLMKCIDAIGGLNTVLYVTIGLIATIKAEAIVDRLIKLWTHILGLGSAISALITGSSSLHRMTSELGSAFYMAAAGADTATFSISTLQLAVGALVAVIGIALLVHNRMQKSLEETADSAEEAASKAREEAAAMQELKEKLDDGKTSVIELNNTFRDHLLELGYTDEKINDLVNSYGNLEKAIKGVTIEATKQQLATAQADKRAAFAAARGTFGGNISQDLSPYSNLMGAAYVAQWGTVIDKYQKDVKELNQQMLTVDKKTGDGLLEYYNLLLEKREQLYADALSDEKVYEDYFYKDLTKIIGKIEEDFGPYLEKVKAANEAEEEYNQIFLETLSQTEAGSAQFTEILRSWAGDSEGLIEAFDDVYVKNLLDLAEKVKNGEMSLKAFDAEVVNWIAHRSDQSEEIVQFIASYLEYITAINKVAGEAGIQIDTFESKMAALEAKLHDITELFDDVDKWADVAAKATIEMEETGEISSETIKTMAELVGEGENWLDYLILDNGQLKLNVELWKEKALEGINSDIEALEEELELLQNQNDELIVKLALQDRIANQVKHTVDMQRNTPVARMRDEIVETFLDDGSGGYYQGYDYGYDSQIDAVSESIERVTKLIEAYRAGISSYDKTIQDALDKDKKSEDETLKTFNWIESMLDRIQRKVNEFSRVVGSKFKSLSTRNEASKKEIEAITEEIDLQEKAYRKYIELCESINLSDEIKKTIENGAIDVSDYNEETAELISQYQEWYEAALDTKEAVDELHESLASLYDDEFTRIQTDFENRISLLEYLSNMYNTGINQLETEGYMASTEFYKALTESTEHNVDLLKEELSGLESALQAALNSGEIEMYSEAWYGYITTMNGVKEAIADANLSLAEFAKTMQEIDWEYFDYLQERISNITDESEFLLDLLGEDNIFKDGKLTADGLSVLGLRAMDYNVYMAQADKYAQEIAEIEQQLANDPNNRTLLDRREELLELQRESILAAEDEKDAILDLVQTAIEEELDSLKELIEAYKDALDAAKDLYDYRNKIADETSEISSLQKQLAAYSGDNSEETRATIQQLKDQLVKAQKELEETEYDKYISDQKKLLDNLYAEYELLLNQRMDNTDALLADIIAMVNQNASTISDTLHMTADSVGYTLSDSLQTVWNTSFGTLQNVVTMYGEGFLSQLTTTNQALNNIANLVSNMQTYSNSWANSYIGGVNNSYVPDYSGWTPGGYSSPLVGGYNDWDTESVNDELFPSSNLATSKPITVGGRINAAGATIYRRSDRSDGGTTQYFGSDPIYTVLSQQQNRYGETMLLVRHHSLSSGNTGWFRMSDVRAYKHGGLVDQTGLVWLDGTKQKPETVLNAEDTKRFQTLVESMDKFASKGFRMNDVVGASHFSGELFDSGKTGVGQIGNSGVPVKQEIAISIPIDHVYDYEDFLNQLRNDKDGKRIIQALALDDIAGKNSLRVKRYNI